MSQVRKLRYFLCQNNFPQHVSSEYNLFSQHNSFS